MKTQVETTLERARRIAAETGGKSRLAKASGLPYASLHDLLRAGLDNRSLANLSALEKALDEIDATPSDEEAA